jgi:hypothetical protein
VRAGNWTSEFPVASESVAGPLMENGEAVKVPSGLSASVVTRSVPPKSVMTSEAVKDAGLAVVRVPCRRVMATRLLAPAIRHSLYPCLTSEMGPSDDPAIAPA